MKIAECTVTDLVTHLLVAHGASDDNATTVSEHLVQSDRFGLPSHGLIRVRQYLAEIAAGQLMPAAIPTVEARDDTMRWVDGHFGFGQVAGMAAAAEAEVVAERHGCAVVAVRNVQHTGRLGAYTQTLSRRGYVVLAFAAGAPRFHRVVPFGGRDGRLSTNPIAWAAPTVNGVLSADFATSSVPEGRIRVLHGAGEPAPPDAICDSEGTPTTDTSLFYGDPPRIQPGALLPLGGAMSGHKGYALGLLSEVMATILAGDRTETSVDRANNLTLLAIKADPALADRTAAMVSYVKSARPRASASEVLVPGEPEQRHYAESAEVELPDFVWDSLRTDFADAGIAVPAELSNARPPASTTTEETP